MVDYASLKDALKGLAGALFGLVWLLPMPAAAQAPFATDDAGVTPAGDWHFELFLSQADLQPLDRPATGQTTLVASAAYGLFGRLELGVDAPWIAIDQAGEPGIRGLGDLNVSAKLHLRDYAGGLLPGAAISVAVETPTGDEENGLGSGIVDYGLALIGEWEVARETALRANAGVMFAGNNVTGAVGIQGDSEIVAAGLSLTRTFAAKWDLGVELAFAESHSAASDQELVAQLGGRYLVSEKLTLAAGLARGWYIAPEWLLQLGVIWDP